MYSKKGINFTFEEPEHDLLGFKKTFMTVFDQNNLKMVNFFIFSHKSLVGSGLTNSLYPDPDSVNQN